MIFRKIRIDPLNPELITKYKTYKNLLEKLIRSAKKEYYRTKLLKYENEPKKLWNFINNKHNKPNREPDLIQQDNVMLDESKDIAEAFSSFFSDIGPKLAEKLKTSNDNRIPNEKKPY